jgi:hypothetical protein
MYLNLKIYQLKCRNNSKEDEVDPDLIQALIQVHSQAQVVKVQSIIINHQSRDCLEKGQNQIFKTS